MSEEYPETVETENSRNPLWKMYATHTILFLLTFLTTTLAGVQWLLQDPFELTNFSKGLTFSFLILFMLGSHEFGHYFAARYHRVQTTLPFFIPFPSFLGLVPFGTLGAVIRIRSAIPSRKILFDIGSAGPIAGFVASLAILIFGIVTLPSREYLYLIHPEYVQLSAIPEGGLRFGDMALYSLMAQMFAPPDAFIPPMNEVYHYPFLCVGWFGLFVTSMNLIPIGQLDGGHIAYAMFGGRYHAIAQAALFVLVILGLSGFLPLAGIEFAYGWTGWLFWAFILVFVMRAMKLGRPPIADETPLDPVRKALGWACAVIFILSFSIAPFTVTAAEQLF
jgi:membrane-associated protease RseP (regulator of RpoE activity)